MKDKIFLVLFVIFTPLTFAYDFKIANEDGVELCYNILADSISVELTKQGIKYDYLTCDTLYIPEKVIYNNKEYTVIKLGESVFRNITPIVRTLIIPKTIKDIRYDGAGLTQQIGKMTFVENNLENIIVSEANPRFMSKDGLLYTHNGDTLIAYPTRNKRDTVLLDEGIIYIAPGAMELSLNVRHLELPLSLKKIGAFALADMDSLRHLVIKDNVDTLNDRSIACYNLTRLTLGNGLKYVENFVETDSVLQIYCRATTPPATRSNNTSLFNHIPSESILYVPAKSISTYRNTAGWNNIQNILPIEPPIVETADGAIVSWVQNFSATGYVWHLYKDEAHTQLVMSLTFDSNGHLTHIDLGNLSAAPSRMQTMLNDDDDDEPQQRFAEYYSFTISSLQPNTTYYYSRQSLAGEEVIDEEQGSFKTLTDQSTRLDNAQQNNAKTTKDLRDGQLIITAPSGKQYTPSGAEVR